MRTSLEWRLDFRRLLRPAGLLVALPNLLPILGVLAWGWDVFLVLVLYWFETVIVAFWTILRVARGEPTETQGTTWSGIPLALFFTLHSGIFIAVHFVFLWSLFAGDWPRHVHGLGDFFSVVVLRTGLWIPLLFMFVVHGLGFLRDSGAGDPLRFAARRLIGSTSTVATESERGPRPVSLGPLYARIFAMQIAIIFGGMLALGLGSMAPLLILIGLKTVVDAGAVMVVEEKTAQQ